MPKTVKKGEDEYAIIVSGVKDTGLCGGEDVELNSVQVNLFISAGAYS